MASDGVGEDAFAGIRGFALSMNYDDVAEAQRRQVVAGKER